jgi:hypothetical protein
VTVELASIGRKKSASSQQTADLSTALRFGRDDNFVVNEGSGGQAFVPVVGNMR